MTPLIVTDVEAFWKPEPWFVVVLTATGAVLLLALGWLLGRILRRLAQSLQAPSKPARAQLLNSIQGSRGSIERQMEAPSMEMSKVPRAAMSLVCQLIAQVEGSEAALSLQYLPSCL